MTVKEIIDATANVVGRKDVSEYLNKFKEGHNDPNLDDFALMVERHSDKDYNYSVMRRRFERAIARATASKEEK